MIARSLERRIKDYLDDEGESEFVSGHQTVLVILNRNDDRITPLKAPWSYQAMIHEYLGLVDGTVTIPSAEKEDKKFNLNEDLDELYNKIAMEQYSAAVTVATEANSELKQSKVELTESSDVQKMKEALEKLPDINKRGTEVSKHFAIFEGNEQTARDTRDLRDQQNYSHPSGTFTQR